MTADDDKCPQKSTKVHKRAGRRSMGLAPFFTARLSKEQDRKLNKEAKSRNLPKVYVLREWIAELEAYRNANK